MSNASEADEAKLQALRNTLAASILRGGAHSDEAVGQHVETALEVWERAETAP